VPHPPLPQPDHRPQAFHRTLRSLAADRDHGNLLLALTSAGLIALWIWWAMAARVPVLLPSSEARLQVESDAQVIAAPLAGVVAEVLAASGRRVAQGDVLYRLDARVEQREAAEAERRLEGLRQQLAAAYDERASALAALRQLDALTASRVAEARARAEGARATAEQARSELEGSERLLESQLTSRAAVERLRAETRLRAAEAEAAERAVDRLRSEAEAERQERRTELAALEGTLSRLRAEIGSALEETAARAAEADRLTVRAPFSGRLGDVAVRRIGSVVETGQALAILVPEVEVQVVAFFPPAEALGRIRPGQAAEIRLDAFPWMEYGSLPARVAAVEEATGGDRVRVDLVLLADGRFVGPREHGLRATALVEIERRSPLGLLVRGLGRPWVASAAAADGR
jgi:multidrug resistance efflux pump